MKEHPVPAYLRIGSPATPIVHDRPVRVTPGGLVHVAGPSDADRTLLTTGAVLDLAREWLTLPQYEGWALHSIPVWGARLREHSRGRLAGFAEIVTVEDHLLDGGFGSWVLETFATEEPRPRIGLRALDPRVAEAVGKEDYLRSVGGLLP
jgi:transketolase